jgi:hypothetical protein
MRILTVEIPKSLTDFGSSLAKNMLDSVAKFDLGNVLKDTWDFIKNAALNITGHRAIGGNAYIDRSILVGEKGPEIFTPGTNGNITPNRALFAPSASSTQPSSVSANFNVTFNIDGGLNANNIESLRAPILGIIEDAWNEVASAPTRGAII